LVEYAREQAKKDGREVTVTDYNGKKLYTDNQKARRGPRSSTARPWSSAARSG
jgi:hypothetical protein